MNPVDLPVRMGAKIRVDGNGCWIWTASRNSKGYGLASVGGGAIALAHRIAYELLVGPIQEGLQIDHLCRVRECVNPSHLEPVTAAENVRRSRAHITHCPKGHEYTPENTIRNHGTRRNCRTCAIEYQRALRAARFLTPTTP